MNTLNAYILGLAIASAATGYIGSPASGFLLFGLGIMAMAVAKAIRDY